MDWKQITPEELKLKLELHLKWLKNEMGGERADLSSANLRSANLSYADLSSADLSYADLRSADLSYADLSYANLRSADLLSANLSSANLSSANLRSADLLSADLSSANLSYADLSYANLSYADLRSANLSSADLSSADLSYANLSYANLRSADLLSANLSSANLSYADLRSANLSSANLLSADLRKTLYEGIDWLAYIGIIPDSKGKARAYKVVKKNDQGIQYSGIDYLKNKIVSVTHDDFDTDVNVHCSRGINLATFQWCLNVKTRDTYKLLLMEFDASPDNVCVPLGTDGKFRVKKAKRIGECDWQGRCSKLFLKNKRIRSRKWIVNVKVK